MPTPSGVSCLFLSARNASAFTQNHATNRIPRPKRAQHAQRARGQVILIQVEGNHRPRRTGVGIAVENHRCIFLGHFTPQQLLDDQVVHAQVGLVQPEAFHVGRLQVVLAQVLADQFRDHRADFLEHLAAFLHEQLVAAASALFRRAVEEAEVVADVVGEYGLQLGAEDVELVRRGGQVGPLHQYRGGGITEDEVAVAVTEVQVPGADFRADHQQCAGLTQLHAVGGSLDAERGRRTRNVHVEGEALNTQRLLHFDGNGRVRALQVGAGDDHAVDIGGRAAGAFQSLARGGNAHLAEDRLLVVGALRQARLHALRVEDAGLVHDEAALDARGLFDERSVGHWRCLELATLDGSGIVEVELLRPGVEGRHQFFVGNALGRGIQAGAADHDVMHGRSSGQRPSPRGAGWKMRNGTLVPDQGRGRGPRSRVNPLPQGLYGQPQIGSILPHLLGFRLPPETTVC